MTTAVDQNRKAPVKASAPKPGSGGPRRQVSGGNQGGGRPPRGGNGPRRERVKPEYEQKILNIRRVTRVMAGGRRFSFSVALVIGNKAGLVGVGIGKAADTSLAIQKAYNHAQRNLVKVELTEARSIPFEVNVKYSTAQIKMMPNTARGLVAGSAMRTVLELGGITDTTGQILSRSKNQLNIARATIKAMTPFAKPYVKSISKKTEAKKESDQVLTD